ncbi:MAG TPA: hypothetical protein VH120_03285 [Gemmataceae bacterium]|nr:hypothetical protein [Gemmataceae bacterium]
MGKPQRLALAAGLLLAVGCTGDGGRDGKRDDPLLGFGGRTSNPSTAVANNAPAGGIQPPAPPAYKSQPPLTAATPTSNAALAGGGVQSLPGGNGLRIGGDNPAPAFAPPAATQPVAGVTPAPPPGAPAPQPASTPIAAGSLDQAYAAVTTKSPLSYRMTFNSQTGEYTFQMTVPSKLNTAAVQHVEATSANPTDAIRRTLEQLPN